MQTQVYRLEHTYGRDFTKVSSLAVVFSVVSDLTCYRELKTFVRYSSRLYPLVQQSLFYERNGVHLYNRLDALV
jgi:hypothetical protein